MGIARSGVIRLGAALGRWTPRRSRRAEIRVRPPTLGVALGMVHAVGRASGGDPVTEADVSAETAGPLLDALAVDPPRSFRDEAALVSYARAVVVLVSDALRREAESASRAVGLVARASAVLLEGDGYPGDTERALGQMDPAQAAALMEMPYGQALRLMGYGAVAAEIKRQMSGPDAQ